MPADLPQLLTRSTLTLCSTDISAPPMTSVAADGTRLGYEPDVAAALGEDLGLELAWIDVRSWDDFFPTVLEGRCDAILCNQAITAERQKVVDYTIPYGRFDEAILAREDSGIAGPDDLRGKRVGAIEGTTNMEAARSFADSEIVPFTESDDNIFEDLIGAVSSGEIDAAVDDELVLNNVAAAVPGLAVPFVIPTQNPYGIVVRPGADELRSALDGALARLIESGSLEAIWTRWFPGKPFGLAA